MGLTVLEIVLIAICTVETTLLVIFAIVKIVSRYEERQNEIIGQKVSISLIKQDLKTLDKRLRSVEKYISDSEEEDEEEYEEGDDVISTLVRMFSNLEPKKRSDTDEALPEN